MRRLAALALLLCAAGARCSRAVVPEASELAAGAPGRRLQQAASAGVPCEKLVDTDAPEEWAPAAQLNALELRLAAHALLQHWWAGSGGAAMCGPLTASPDADLLVLGACTNGHLTALMLFAQYKCGQQTYGVKLLGTAKRMPGKDPRAGQVAEVEVAPSSGAVQQPVAAAAAAAVPAAAASAVTRGGKQYSRANFDATGPGSTSYQAMLAKTNKQAAKIFLKSKAGTWRVIQANPASFGSTFQRRPKASPPPPKRPPPPPPKRPPPPPPKKPPPPPPKRLSPPPPLRRPPSPRPPPPKRASPPPPRRPPPPKPPNRRSPPPKQPTRQAPPPARPPPPRTRSLLQEEGAALNSSAQFPPPQAVRPAASAVAAAAASPTCDDITGAPGAYADVTGSVPPAFFTDAVQAAFLMWYSQIEAGITAACPLVKIGGKVDLGALQADVMTLCRKAPEAGDDGTYYGLRFTAYLPCMQTEGRYAVLEAVVLQPEPRYTAAFEVREVTATATTTSAYGIGWGADVGISKRMRVAVSFTRVSTLVPVDIAVDPSDPSNMWAVGPANTSAISSACGQPVGGPLLKWDYATSRFASVPGISVSGYRVTVMPETHMPWIVDGCGQLRGWTATMKALFGPAPQTNTFFDIAAINGTVYSGCASYDPRTFRGDIATGCDKHVAVGPNKRLAVADPHVRDVAVTASGLELWFDNQWLTYADPTYGRRFRVANQLPGLPLRLAAGTDGAIWLTVAAEGTYRGYAYNPAQPTKPSLSKTCSDVDPLCADGGCDAGLTACLRCAPDAVMQATGQCRPMTCADVDPNCAECWEGVACRRCKPGYVRGYHGSDTRCRPAVTGIPRCFSWDGNMLPTAFPNETWVAMGGSSLSGAVAAVTAQGRVFVAANGYAGLADAAPQSGNTWRTATTVDWQVEQAIGVDTSGRILGFAGSFSVPGNRLVLSLAPFDPNLPFFWYVTTDGLGFYMYDTTELVQTRVHAVCVGSALACFLTTSGRAVCAEVETAWGPFKPTKIFQPGGLEPLVGIACGGAGDLKYACGLTASGEVTCFGPGPPKYPSSSLKFKSLLSGGPPGPCGITVGGELYCWSNEWERTYSQAGSNLHVLAVSTAGFCSLDASN